MSESEKGNLKYSKSRFNLRIGEYIGSSAWRAIPVFALVGILISYQFKLTMNKDVWFWFFSSIAQTFASLVALVAVFLLSRLGSYDAIINKNIDIMRTLIQEFTGLIKKDAYGIDDFSTSSNLVLIILIDSWMPILTKLANTEDKAESDPKERKMRASLIIRARNDIKHLEQKKERAKEQMKILLEHTVLIIMLSILLIPFGSVNTENSLILDLWNNYNLKWGIIFGVVGLCIASLYKVKSELLKFLSEK